MLSESEIRIRKTQIEDDAIEAIRLLLRASCKPGEVTAQQMFSIAGLFYECAGEARLLAREIAADESGVVKRRTSYELVTISPPVTQI